MKKLIVLLLWTLSIFQLSAKDVNILEFGAKGDGKFDNTSAIQKAIDACAKEGGGTVVISEGTFLSGTLFLKDNITLRINRMAVLKGIPKLDSYPGIHFREKGFIRIDGVQNVTIEGEGIIDGSGGHEVFQQGEGGNNRPYLVHVRKSKHVVIKDINLKSPAFWTLRLFENDGVRIDGISIYSHSNWNNDGIDIDSKNVLISNCRIDTDDDGICFKSDGTQLCENITVTNCIIGSDCNPIKFGTAGHAGFKNIAISNCVIQSASESIHWSWRKSIEGVADSITGISGIALEMVDGGIIDQITISNISMVGIQTPIFIRLGSRKNPTGSLKNVLISNITASARSLIPSIISAVPGFYVENVVIRDMIVSCMGGGTVEHANRLVPENEKGYPENRMFGNTLPAYGWYVRHAKNITLNNIQFFLDKPDYRPAIVLDDAHAIKIRDLIAPKPIGNREIIVSKNSDFKLTD
ncbi:MAG TPA: glycosyl hydrolase family 28 protein [Prolixibacteraceae bacterium]|nr:glycosyl hydrolase family 28 protein [Prolixibacteraceae bacterium]